MRRCNLCLLLAACLSVLWGSARAQESTKASTLCHESQQELAFPRRDIETGPKHFVVKIGRVDSFDNAVALDVNYEPILELRKQLTQTLGRDLKFFQGWKPEGEAHVTTITPVEFRDHLSERLSMKDIAKVITRHRVKNIDLEILGLGHGSLREGADKKETHFLIVRSQALRQVRKEVYDLFLSRGGKPGAFDPDWFFPHITIGYTHRDLHESDGLIKNLKHSFDERFQLSH